MRESEYNEVTQETLYQMVDRVKVNEHEIQAVRLFIAMLRVNMKVKRNIEE